MKFARLFRIVPDHYRKIFFPEQTNFGDLTPPPSPKKFRSVYHFTGPKIFRTHKIYRISHKIDRICPIYFYYKPILPDCEANIARLAFLPNKLGVAAAPPRHPARYAHVLKFSRFNFTFRFYFNVGNLLSLNPDNTKM